MKEKDILLHTAEAFQKLTGGNIEILETEKREKDKVNAFKALV